MQQDPKALRKVYFDAWQKELKGDMNRSPMEEMIIDIIRRHPEYYAIFENTKTFTRFEDEKFDLGHNPFFHLSLHVTVSEQVGADRPPGIRDLYLQLLKKYGDQTEVEHLIMEKLARLLLNSFRNNEQNSEAQYLNAVKELV